MAAADEMTSKPAHQPSFTDRHPALALCITLASLVVAGLVFGHTVGTLGVEVLGVVLARLGAPG